MDSVRIGTGLIEMLERAAWHAAPHEACALLLGTVTEERIDVSSAVVTDNVTDGDPEASFEIDPAMHIQLQKLARVGGPAVVGVWHSHPKSEPVPSATDKAQSTEPGWVWLITGKNAGETSTKAFVADQDDPGHLQPMAMDLVPR